MSWGIPQPVLWGKTNPKSHSPHRSGSWQRAARRAPRRARLCSLAGRALPVCPCKTERVWMFLLPSDIYSYRFEHAAALGRYKKIFWSLNKPFQYTVEPGICNLVLSSQQNWAVIPKKLHCLNPATQENYSQSIVLVHHALLLSRQEFVLLEMSNDFTYWCGFTYPVFQPLWCGGFENPWNELHKHQLSSEKHSKTAQEQKEKATATFFLK